MPTCRQCQTPFKVTKEDRDFYEKMAVPEPTLCPDCRQQRRLAWRNERALYSRKCDLSGEPMISCYPPDAPYKVYRVDLWHSDAAGDGLAYGRDYNFNRPFFEQFQELQLQVPRPSLTAIEIENSPYGNHFWRSKNCYMCFDAGYLENCLYCSATYHCKDTVDCTMTRDSELSYFLIDCQNCYQSFYLQDCQNCHDVFFSYDCRGCTNIAFCSNLRNQQNYLFNKPVSAEEFRKFTAQLKQSSAAQWQQYISNWQEQVIKQAIHRLNHNISAEQCSGDYIINSKNCHDCFDVDTTEDSRYCVRMDERLNSCYDCNNLSIGDLMYETITCTGHRLRFCTYIWSPSSDCDYSDLLMTCSDCFGCVGLKHKKFCILNKAYPPAEYARLKEKIIQQMRQNPLTPRLRSGPLEWGEFFPVELSPFAYNETVAQEFYPLTKEQAQQRGWQWREQSTTAIDPSLPVCARCHKNFKLIPQELNLYQQLGLPAPTECNFCRHLFRTNLRNGHKLFQRSCSKCQKIIETTYSTAQSIKVYCEECYLSAVV